MAPTLWEQAAPVVARGAALVAVGIISEWVLRSLARGAMNAPRNGKKAAKTRALARAEQPKGPEMIAISETVIMMRKVIVRR
jgi:hypothetical protein